MTGRAPFTWQRVGDELVLAGAIDEDARLGELVSEARAGRLALDLGGITFINSIGVREWVRMQAAASVANVTVDLRRVAEPLIFQFNVVPATRRASSVSSFFATYACESCHDEQLVLIEVAKLDPANLAAPRAACTRCRAALELANPAELYFTFLTGGSALS